MPTPKKRYRTIALPREPEREEWALAVAELRQGNGAFMAQLLQEFMDLPLRLLPLFSIVLADEALCREKIAAYREGELEVLQQEQQALFIWRPPTLKESQAAMKRMAELPRLLSSAANRKAEASLAGDHLHSLHLCFPELFGLPRPEVIINRTLPPATHSKLREIDLDLYNGENWRDCLREAEQKAAEGPSCRRIVVAGANVRPQSES